jgi:phosphoadenosine phosphosulfate reductase
MSTTVLAHALVNLDARIAAAANLLARVALEHSPVAFASSFGAEDMVVLDLIAEQRLPIEVFTLDTGRLPEETHALIDVARRRYGLTVRAVYPDAERLEHFTREEGSNAFYRSVELRQQCCEIRKLEPLLRVLAGKRAWVTGLRREQAVTRSALVALHRDPSHGLMKCNPLADWSERDVWAYIRSRDVPYNALHDRGYPSIGCAPCTRAVAAGDDVRSGRWWWERPQTKECGLHLNDDGRLVRRADTAADDLRSTLPA